MIYLSIIYRILIHIRLLWWAISGQAKIDPLNHDRPGSCVYCKNWTPIYAQTCKCGRTGEARYNARARKQRG